MSKSFLKTLGALFLVAGFSFSQQAYAYLFPCQLVTQMAGSNVYESKLQRVASMTAPQDMPSSFGLELLERHGAWYIYHTPTQWFKKDTCGPFSKEDGKKGFAFMPVLLNKKTGHNAVLTGTFLLKVYKPRDLQDVIERYGFHLLTNLPNPDSAIVDVRPTKSYDDLIEKLDKDRDVDLLAPLTSEPMYQPR